MEGLAEGARQPIARYSAFAQGRAFLVIHNRPASMSRNGGLLFVSIQTVQISQDSNDIMYM